MTNNKRWALLFFLSPVLLWLVVMIVLPHIDLLIMSFRFEADDGQMIWSFNNYLSFFEEPIYWLTFVRTALYSILVTFLTVVIALPLAFYITKVVVPKFQGFLLVLLLLPFWVSELVRVYGWMILLRESGVINHFLIKLGVLQQPVEMLYTDATMILGLVYTSMLFMVVPIISVLESLDDSLIEAAYDLGANMWSILFKIIIPHATPGIVSGSIVVFMLTLGNYLTPNLMGGKNSLWFTEQIYNQFIASFNWNQGSAFGFLLLVLSSLVVWLGLKLTGQNLQKVVQ
jgi:spermidine/putrescine transport system permease protein